MNSHTTSLALIETEALAITEIARHEAKARGLAEQLTQALREVE